MMIRARMTFVLLNTSRLARGQHVADVGKTRLGDPSAAPDEQFRGAALGEREPGDPLVRKRVVETVYIYMSLHICRNLCGKVTIFVTLRRLMVRKQ